MAAAAPAAAVWPARSRRIESGRSWQLASAQGIGAAQTPALEPAFERGTAAYYPHLHARALSWRMQQCQRQDRSSSNSYRIPFFIEKVPPRLTYQEGVTEHSNTSHAWRQGCQRCKAPKSSCNTLALHTQRLGVTPTNRSSSAHRVSVDGGQVAAGVGGGGPEDIGALRGVLRLLGRLRAGLPGRLRLRRQLLRLFKYSSSQPRYPMH